MNPLLLSGIFEIGKSIIDRLFPDPAAKAAAQMELIKKQQNRDLAMLAAQSDIAKAQLAVNAAEASSGSLFVAGWRPCVGWICALALGYEFLARPMLTLYQGSPMPELDLTDLYSLLFGMLGIGGLRTIEKIKGVATK